jgi:outer membrane protein
MKYFLRTIFLLLVSLQGFSQTLSLEDAVNIALKNSLDIQLAKNNVEARGILNNYGVAGGLPLVTANASNSEQITDLNQKYDVGGTSTRTVTTKGAASNTLNAGVTGSILLYNGMRVVSTKKRLGELEKQSQELLNSQIQNIIAGVMTSYYDVVRQQTYIKTIDLSINVAQQQLDIVKTRQSVGLANNADLFQAQLDLNQLVQSKQTQQLVIDQARSELLRQLTINTDSSVVISDTIIVDRSVALNSITDNLRTNADILAAERQIIINQLIVKETAAQRYPSISANGGYNYSRTQNAAGQTLLNQRNGPLLGVTLSIPIYNGSALKRQQQAAEIDVRNAEIQKKVLERDYTANAVRTYQAYASTLQQLETAEKNFRLAQQLVDLVLMRFQLRQATIIELRQAQQSFETAAYTLTNFSFAAKSSEIELKRLANQLKF